MDTDFLGAYRGLLEKLTGRTVGTAPSNTRDFLGKAYETYGALKSPTEYAAEINAKGRQEAGNIQSGIRGQMAASYNAYKDTAKQLGDLYAQRSAEATTPEAQQQERAAYSAARQEAFAPHLANRAYLKTQNKLAAAGRTQAARDRTDQRIQEIYARNGGQVGAAGVNPFAGIHNRAREKNAKVYESVKDLGRGLEVPREQNLALEESIGRMMSEAGSQIKSRRRAAR